MITLVTVVKTQYLFLAGGINVEQQWNEKRNIYHGSGSAKYEIGLQLSDFVFSLLRGWEF